MNQSFQDLMRDAIQRVGVMSVLAQVSSRCLPMLHGT